MPLIFVAPTVEHTTTNPAEQFASGAGAGGGFDLGFTEPLYNSKVAFGEPGTILLHEIDIQEHERKFHARIVRVHDHTFSWRIKLPPRPSDVYILDAEIRRGWKSSPHPIGSILQVCKKFKERFPGAFDQPVPEAAGRSFGVIYFLPAPSPDEFFAHIRNHEMQHAADHRWLAQEIFGPIHEWAKTAQDKNITFKSANKIALSSRVQFPSAYAISSVRIFKYWQRSIEQSGALFHGTNAGEFPRVSLVRMHTSYNDPRTLLVVFEVAAAHPIGNRDMNSPPHAPFKLVPVNDSLDGNEPDLACDNPVDRTIRIPDVLNAAANATINVDAAGEDDEDDEKAAGLSIAELFSQ